MSNNFGGRSGGGLKSAGVPQSATWHSIKLVLNAKKSIKYINFSI